MQLIVRLGVCAALAGLAGCHMFTVKDECAERQPYEGATSVPQLRAAEGLPTANTKNALKIPDAAGEAKPRKSTDACLDRPPPFYADRPKPAPAKK